MSEQLTKIAQNVRSALGSAATGVGSLAVSCGSAIRRHALGLTTLGVLTAGGYALYTNPPVQSIGRGEVGIRLNQVTGNSVEVHEGAALVIPHLHGLRRFSLRDQVYRPIGGLEANGRAPFQSVEGLSLGIDISVRYALDPKQIAAVARNLPEDLNGEIVEPMVQGVLYKTLSRYTVREIFSSKRQDIQESIERELIPRLAADGIVLESVTLGKVDLPRDYRSGMETLLAEELASEKMRYTLELKDKQVKQSELEALAQKVRRETAAEAAAQERIIAARAQAEAMKHVLPFKQKEIEQRGLEAEAEKVTRIKRAEATAQSRRIEAAGEADSRRQLADAEAYRQERMGKVASEQLARDGALIDKHPLLIQKTMADKLSDKISVIIAPPPRDGGFIGAALLGSGRVTPAPSGRYGAPDGRAAEDSSEGGQ